MRRPTNISNNTINMNVKGIRINKKLAYALNQRIDDIPLGTLRGLDVFNSFNWIGFSKNEFKSLLSLFDVLISTGCFARVEDDHLFVFNYSTDVAEMDIASVVRMDDRRVFIDIESKNGSDDHLPQKINRQIEKRIKNHLPQLLGSNPYIIAGFTNGNLVKCVYFDGAEKLEITSMEEFAQLTNEFEGDNEAEGALYQSSSLASIVRVCSDIRSGKYSYFEETCRLSDALMEAQRDYDCAVVFGNAGTGKSVLALKIFFENQNSKFLVLNSKLYFAMGLSREYAKGRATFNSKSFISSIGEDTVSIVDECQRLPLEQIKQIVEKSKFTFLFGDCRQTFSNTGFLDGAERLSEILESECGVKCFTKIVKKTRRYSDEVADALDMLTSLDESKTVGKLPGDYSIKVFFDENDFMSEFASVSGNKKLYLPICDARSETLSIGGKIFRKAENTDDNFSIWSSNNDVYGLTYHALSFDVDHSFVFLPDARVIEYGKKRVLYTFNKPDPLSFVDIRTYLNELNVLFTRGRKSLNILAKDIETYLYLKTLVNKLR